MGSKGSKSRKSKQHGKPKQPQHLPKVGTATENQRLMHDEQHAVLEQMGVHGDGASKSIVTVILVVFAVGAILGLIGLTVALVR